MKRKVNFSVWTAMLAGILLLPSAVTTAQTISAEQLRKDQQDFVNLGFGMFIHYGIATYVNDDWADPDAPASLFNPKKLDAEQWAKAAKSANMTYGCLTTKHHSGFPIWDTKTTDYNVMNSPLKRDVVKEYADAFRKNGLKVMLYYSILDTHHELRPGQITKAHIGMVKEQLRELLTNYGTIDAMIIDGWDAPWSRISYDDVPFEEIYMLIKSIQPRCLVMDLNAAKYPAEALFYTDIKSYEQGAGQHISKESNKLPALSCLPLQSNWFWKTSMPRQRMKNPEELVNKMLVPFNQAYCNFILNVAPNRDGQFDDNALEALKQIGKLYNKPATLPSFPEAAMPIISHNKAKFQPANTSWSNDYAIMDFGNDDRFGTAWNSHPSVKKPWYEVELSGDKGVNLITITEDGNITKYRLEYSVNGVWKTLVNGTDAGKVKVHRFNRVWADKVRIVIEEYKNTPSINEFGVYDERK
ncbi:alpha-L-fucosidase [Chitinophaga horti]|uniref:alpha-L-fucosidase n=1 Tax=Chitinophaga horti TaxID=2920382 RepID=A0ABY6J8U4_9BACT|nr:alpha-L-fucosidase [Chitinophaga horti]UYQ95905.1 alpha-L-fucosidase [Chitinophaga horti]